MRVSVIIPTLNAGPHLGVLLERLRAQKPAPPDEIIVVDSGSRDQTREIAAQAGARVIEWREPYNHGLTRDAGIAASSGDVVVLTVQDACPASDDWLARLTAHFADDSVAGVSGLQVPPPDGPLELRIKAALDVRAGDAPIRVRLSDHPAYAQYTPAQRLELYRFDNVCAALRRSVWERIPFGACRYAEDLAWAKRALEAGHTVVHDPAACVIHAHRRSFCYEFRRALLDAWMLDELFGFRYGVLNKLNRAKSLAGNRASLLARLAAARTYFAHALARLLYAAYRRTLKPLGLGGGLLARTTTGV
jgi:rhamnosyltransferase